MMGSTKTPVAKQLWECPECKTAFKLPEQARILRTISERDAGWIDTVFSLQDTVRDLKAQINPKSLESMTWLQNKVRHQRQEINDQASIIRGLRTEVNQLKAKVKKEEPPKKKGHLHIGLGNYSTR